MKNCAFVNLNVVILLTLFLGVLTTSAAAPITGTKSAQEVLKFLNLGHIGDPFQGDGFESLNNANATIASAGEIIEVTEKQITIRYPSAYSIKERTFRITKKTKICDKKLSLVSYKQLMAGEVVTVRWSAPLKNTSKKIANGINSLSIRIGKLKFDSAGGQYAVRLKEGKRQFVLQMQSLGDTSCSPNR